MRSLTVVRTVVAGTALLLSACGSDHDPGGRMMTMGGPSGYPMSGVRPGLVSMSPGPGASVSASAATILLRFSVPMAVGMEQWVDLHRNDLSGQTVPLSCSWSADRTTLTCLPEVPLAPGTYALHVGGGMHDASGAPVDLGAYHHGGQWAMPGPGAMHGGHPWGGMGPGWYAGNGSYGMVFTFTVS